MYLKKIKQTSFESPELGPQNYYCVIFKWEILSSKLKKGCAFGDVGQWLRDRDGLHLRNFPKFYISFAPLSPPGLRK